ncbi:MAG: hypothetical protein JWO38_1379 [Gemmataceae bacterium]|nr:hypothetical protein [Gemmataceae bacterium]
MRTRTAAIVTTLVFLAGLAVGRLLPRTFSTETPVTPVTRPSVVAVIDAEIPGTKVFHRGQLLGEVPLELTRERLAELGLDLTRPNYVGSLDHDGWGEALIFGEMDEDELKLMLQVPDAEADRFLGVETPWGRRTKMGPWKGPGGEEPRRVLAYFQKAQEADGLRFRVGLPDRVRRGTKAVVELSCEIAGPAVVTGRRPHYRLLWGGFDTPWRRRVCLEDQPLPVEWATIAPGQTVRATFEMDVPPVAGDYSVFAVLHYDEPAEGAKRTRGGTYSNSRVLRVR